MLGWLTGLEGRQGGRGAADVESCGVALAVCTET